MRATAAVPNGKARSHMTALPATLARTSAALLLVACAGGEGPRDSAAAAAPRVATTDAEYPDDGQWTTQAKDPRGWRYSGLRDIDTASVARLREAWSFSTGTLRGHEGAPLVVGSTMYVVTPFPNVAYALDLAAPTQPTVKWKFEPNPAQRAVGKACCDVVNRGWAYADGRLVYNLLDAHTVAVDAETGRELWRIKLDEVRNGITMTMAPFIVRDNVLVGSSGGEMGGHGWLAALDLATGKERWRAYATGSDSLVRIDSTFRPYYPRLRQRDLGVSTWPQDEWSRGGGASWAWVTYDSTQDLVFYGTSNPSPWNQEQRPGDNLYTSAILARDPDTGMARWAYQTTPHDEWDYDGVNENLVLDLPVDGAGRPPRPVLVHFDRNAFAYVIDRRNGQVLSATPFQEMNWADSVNLATGVPVVRQEKRTWEDRWTKHICPHALGAKNHPPTSWSPRTRLVYAPTMNLCMDFKARKVSYIAGTPYWGAETTIIPGPGGHRGELVAWDPVARRAAWRVRETFPVHSGTLATAGDLVFYGTVEGDFKAVHARTGRLLWKHRLPSGIIGAPMTYRGPDGKQYVAILAGIGGVMGVFQKEPGYPTQGGSLHVFSLP